MRGPGGLQVLPTKHEHPAPALLQNSVYRTPGSILEPDPRRQVEIQHVRVVIQPTILDSTAPAAVAQNRPASTSSSTRSDGVQQALAGEADTDLLFVECNESARPYGCCHFTARLQG